MATATALVAATRLVTGSPHIFSLAMPIAQRGKVLVVTAHGVAGYVSITHRTTRNGGKCFYVTYANGNKIQTGFVPTVAHAYKAAVHAFCMYPMCPSFPPLGNIGCMALTA